ncbi:MAG: HypC/HybG/HupF family hydrogenase formation chaperone [Candidatus Hodarchaeales archaeon]
MCLAIPAKIVQFLSDNLVLADFGRGVQREVSVALIPIELKTGDWILIHTGYAVSKVDQQEAKELLALWEEIWDSGQSSAST